MTMPDGPDDCPFFDMVIHYPGNGSVLAAGCNTCRTIYVCENVEMVMEWATMHTHDGDVQVTVAEIVAPLPVTEEVPSK